MSGTIEFMEEKKKTVRLRDASGPDTQNSADPLNAITEEQPRLLGNETNGSLEMELYEKSDDLQDMEKEEGEVKREGWDNKVQFLLSVIGYAVGLGNVWRFPYLCQQNGGGAFLIPYMIMMVVEGAPVFLIEMGIGQRLRVGPIGVWNQIHPYLGGVGISSAIVSFLVGLYYNVIIAWCLFYFFKSFASPLPWAHCPVDNGTEVEECARSSETSYYWYRKAVDTTANIEDFGGLNWEMTACLIAAWLLVWVCVMKGIKTSGKVMYLTATFPYIVTTIFLIRAVMLPGAFAGIVYMFTPDLQMLADPRVWLDAATQIFYSMGLAFGGLIAFSSYNPPKNNVKRDVITLSIANLFTSMYTAIVIFAILGYKGHLNHAKCDERNVDLLLDYYPERYPNTSMIPEDLRTNFPMMIELNFSNMERFTKLAGNTETCDLVQIMKDAAEGTGLAFIVFTQAMVEFPGSPFWAVIFFLMLLSLGMGSMFGTLEGVITSIYDLKLFTWLKKPVLTAILCGFSCVVGLLFVSRAGEFWVKLFDAFAGSYALMAVAFWEVIGVVYVYGWRRFSDDIEHMTGSRPGKYWQYTWRFVSPVIMLILFWSSVIASIMRTPKYHAYDMEKAKPELVPYPVWCKYIAGIMVFVAMAPVPFVAFVRYFKIVAVEQDIPTSLKHLNSTQSTTYMLKSQQSFGRLDSAPSVDLVRNDQIELTYEPRTPTELDKTLTT